MKSELVSRQTKNPLKKDTREKASLLHVQIMGDFDPCKEFDANPVFLVCSMVCKKWHDFFSTRSLWPHLDLQPSVRLVYGASQEKKDQLNRSMLEFLKKHVHGLQSVSFTCDDVNKSALAEIMRQAGPNLRKISLGYRVRL
jgi:hypothetical protein